MTELRKMKRMTLILRLRLMSIPKKQQTLLHHPKTALTRTTKKILQSPMKPQRLSILTKVKKLYHFPVEFPVRSKMNKSRQQRTVRRAI